MKPCSNNRELIALLALAAVDARQEQRLRAHLETCQGCRRYLEEISRVTNSLATAEIRADIQTSEWFHQKLVGRLKGEASAARGEKVMARARTRWSRSQKRWERFLTSSSSSTEEEMEKTSARIGSWFTARFALPLAVAIAVLITAWSLFVRRSQVPLRGATAAPTSWASKEKTELEPSVANYQTVANQSLEKLDELLTKQGNRNPPSVPTYSASTLARLDASD